MKDIRTLIGQWDKLLEEDGQELDASVLKAGATEHDIVTLEARLGLELPPSYREFLAATNGADLLPNFWSAFPARPGQAPTALLPAAEAGWARDVDPELVDSWLLTAEGDGNERRDPALQVHLPERDYLDYDAEKDSDFKRGHLMYALAISRSIDGYAILLNPLMVDADGEWEAWDYGAKIGGAYRYPSFRELLETQTSAFRRELEKRVDRADSGLRRRTQPLSAEELEGAIVRSTDARVVRADWRQSSHEAVQARIQAMYRVASSGDPDGKAALLAIVNDPADGDTMRQQAAEALVMYAPEDELAALLLQLAGSDEPRVRAAAVRWLAQSPDERAHACGVDLLSDPSLEDWVLHLVLPAGKDAVWEAWERTHSPRLLGVAAQLRDTRVIEPISAAVVDPALPDSMRRVLVDAVWMLRDPRIVRALLAAADLPGAPLMDIGRTLVYLGASPEGVAVLSRISFEDDPWSAAAAAQLISGTHLPEADAFVLQDAQAHPSGAGLLALAHQRTTESTEALIGLVDSGRGYADRIAIEALELDGTQRSRDELANLAATSPLAVRALARMRDPRALAPLLMWLNQPDNETALDGADGLRDLRSPDATTALLAATKRGDPDVAVTAAHALICMQSPATSEGLHNLIANPDPTSQKLARRWLRIGARRGGTS